MRDAKRVTLKNGREVTAFKVPEIFGEPMSLGLGFWQLEHGELNAIVTRRSKQSSDQTEGEYFGKIMITGPMYLLIGKPRRTPSAAARDIERYLRKLHKSVVAFLP